LVRARPLFLQGAAKLLMLRLIKMLDNFVPHVLGRVPISWRRTIIGRPDKPSGLATFAHNLLNRLPHPESNVFDCQGALEGYRMSVDWKRFRSFVYGTWEPEVTSVITSIVMPGMTVIDIGAHVGYYSLLFAKRVGPTGHVFSFEPLPGNLALLRKNIHLNNLTNVQSFDSALFSRTGELSLSVPDEPSNSGDGSVIHERGSKHVLVQAITLDSFCAADNIQPDLLKMDVEGAEYDAILGAQETIRRCLPKLLVELHHFDGNLAAHPVPAQLVAWGYQIQWVEHSQWTSHILATPGSVESTA
jgi:FkbM family methyltransferase